MSLLAIAPVSAVSASVPAETLTVLECARRAAAVAPAVRAARLSRTAAALDSTAIALNGRPALNLEAGATVAPRGFYDPTITNLGEYRLLLGATGMLADGGTRRRARSEAALVATGAVVDEAQAARDASMRAVELALDLLQNDDRRRQLEEAVAWTSDLATIVDAGVRSGRRGRADAVRVALERDAGNAELIAVRGARGALVRELDALLAAPAGAPIALADPGESADGPPAPADSLALLARAARAPAARAAAVDSARATLAFDEVRRRSALQLTWLANAGLWGADLTRAVPLEVAADHPGATFGDRLRRDLGASVGIELKKPLVDPGRTAALAARIAFGAGARLRMQTAALAEGRAALDQLETWRAAAATVDLARASVDAAEENARRLRSLYAGGAAGVLDVLDARAQLDQARLRLLNARFDVRKAHFVEETP